MYKYLGVGVGVYIGMAVNFLKVGSEDTNGDVGAERCTRARS